MCDLDVSRSIVVGVNYSKCAHDLVNIVVFSLDDSLSLGIEMVEILGLETRILSLDWRESDKSLKP